MWIITKINNFTGEVTCTHHTGATADFVIPKTHRDDHRRMNSYIRRATLAADLRRVRVVPKPSHEVFLKARRKATIQRWISRWPYALILLETLILILRK